MKWSVTMDPDIAGLRKDIKDLGPDGKRWDKALAKVNKRSATVIAKEGRSRAEAMGGMQARAASRIQGSQSAKGLSVRVSKTGAHPEALAAIWGGKKRTGWNAPKPPRTGILGRLKRTPQRADTPNLPEWVGNTWKPGVTGEGPYAVNDAIAAKRDEVIAGWSKAIDELADAAGF